VGKLSELSVSPSKESVYINDTEILKTVEVNGSARITFTHHFTETASMTWEAVLHGSVLYVEVSPGIYASGSREGFISLMEYCEEVLHCSHIVMCFKKDRTDRALLIRTFMFLGFNIIPPGHILIPPSADPNILFMLHTIE